MPYPLAHPAAAVPLARALGRFGVPSALVVGSVVPDLWYFAPFLSRHDSHGFAGLAWFCLPVGLIGYLLYHALLKRPLAGLLPEAMRSRLAPWLQPGLPHASLLAVCVSLEAGAVSHLAWDAFTHAMPALPLPGGEALRLAQHASTLGGVAFLAWWCARRLAALQPRPVSPDVFTPRLRGALLASMLAGAAVAALATAGPASALALDLAELRRLARAASLAAGATLVSLLAIYSLAWHLAAWSGRSNRAARTLKAAKPEWP